MKIREETTRTEFARLSSRLGDVILQRDSVARDGTIVHREICMYVPQEDPRGDNVCML